MNPTNHALSDTLRRITVSQLPDDHPRKLAREAVVEFRSNAQREGLPVSNPHDDKGAPVLDVDSALKWEPKHMGRK